MKTIAFGDIHGCYKAAERAVQLAEKLKAQAVFLGDYVDRGPDSIKTLQILLKAKKQNPNWIFIRGNHDQMLLDLNYDRQKPNTIYEVISGKTSNKETTKVFYQLLALPKYKQEEIIGFLKNTEFYYETDEWIFVHAPLKDSNIPIEQKSREELIWNYDLNPTWEGKQFMHGHYNTKQIEFSFNCINLNTACGYDGKLTGLLIDEDKPSHYHVFEILEDGKKPKKG